MAAIPPFLFDSDLEPYLLSIPKNLVHELLKRHHFVNCHLMVFMCVLKNRIAQFRFIMVRQQCTVTGPVS